MGKVGNRVGNIYVKYTFGYAQLSQDEFLSREKIFKLKFFKLK